MNAMFSALHDVAMCFDDAISTDDVGIGFPEGSVVALAIDDSFPFHLNRAD